MEDFKPLMEHLLFHKALGEEMDQYLALCKKASEDYSDIKDDYNRSIAILFSLAMEEKIDPWDIDLVSFSKNYLARLKKEGVNIVYAGRLILLAWEVLRAQSEKAVEALNEADECEYYEPLELDTLELEPRATRNLKKPVSVFDIVKALEGVKRIEKRERKRKERIKGLSINGMIHAEEMRSEEAYDIIRKDNIDDGDLILSKFGVVEGMVALLYLAMAKRIEIWQENFPFGKICIRMI
jgi:segregation and condensation protein A